MTANENQKSITDEGVYELLDQIEQDAQHKSKAENGVKAQKPSAVTHKNDPHQHESGKRRGSKDRSSSPGARSHKRSLSHKRNRYSEEREENDERRSRRSKDLAEDDARNYTSEEDSANESSRGSHYHGSRRHDSGARHTSPREYSHRRNGTDSYVPGRQSNDPPPRRSDRRHDDDDHNGRPPTRGARDRRSQSQENERERDRGADHQRNRERDRYRRRSRSRSPRRNAMRHERDHRQRDNKARSPPPMPSSDERDRKTVFVTQLSVRTRSKELKEFFDKAGCPVFETQIVKDRVSGRSKGLGYVEFKSEDSVEKALKLTGHKLNGVPMIVQLTEAEKNRQKRKTEGSGSSGAHPPRLYVGNIHFSVTEDDLKSVFDAFGSLDFAKLARDEDNRSKGFGFVQFHDSNSAKQALEAMNGFELGGRALRVGLGSDKMPIDSPNPQQQDVQGSSFSGTGGRGSHAGGSTNFDRASGRMVNKNGGASALDDSDVQGLNNVDRTDLMRKLARVPETKTEAPTQTKEQVIAHSAPQPTRCVLIKNMYDQNDSSLAAGWQQELQDDVRSECENRYGVVKHLALRLDNDDGDVFVKFDRVEGGQNAVRGLNGRYFGGRSLTASYVVEAIYNSMFPHTNNL